ncbi:MAG: M20/M25/M40 family metallo-hydrolase, partial [bacterium]
MLSLRKDSIWRHQIFLISLFISLFSVSQGLSQWSGGPSDITFENQISYNTSQQAVDSLIQSLVNQTNLDTLGHYVNVLSGEDSITIGDSTYLLVSRNPLHSHNELAAEYIFQTLTDFGLSTYSQIYSSNGRNIYSILTGTDYPDQIFIICGHYDDSPFQPPAPGADDNAGSTAAVLEAARILSQVSTPYTIIFALWDEEEMGHIGSNYFAEQLYQNGENILGVINLDMIGWDSNNDGLMDIHTRPIANSVQLANLASSLQGTYQISLSPIIYNPGIEDSDHLSFWKRGYSAILLTEAYYGGDFNPYYHSANDRIIHFNLNYFHAQAKLAVATIAHLGFYDLTSGGLDTWQETPLLDLQLNQNYPNPFNPRTVISWQLVVGSSVKLIVYNPLGQTVKILVDE